MHMLAFMYLDLERSLVFLHSSIILFYFKMLYLLQNHVVVMGVTRRKQK